MSDRRKRPRPRAYLRTDPEECRAGRVVIPSTGRGDGMVTPDEARSLAAELIAAADAERSGFEGEGRPVTENQLTENRRDLADRAESLIRELKATGEPTITLPGCEASALLLRVAKQRADALAVGIDLTEMAVRLGRIAGEVRELEDIPDPGGRRSQAGLIATELGRQAVEWRIRARVLEGQG